MPQYRKDGVTRRLSASVHLDDDFALYVDRMLTGDRLNALGLSLGINFVALARHARVATRRRAALDRRLACLQAALPLTLLVGLWGLVNGHRSLGWVAIFGPLGTCVLAWALVRHDEARSRDRARDVFLAGAKPEQTAPPVESAAETALHELKRANVLPYADEAAYTKPFVGSGERIKEVVWQPIDISRPADAPGGGKLPLRPFDVIDLHTYVARHMESISGLQGLRARNRLYVLGSNAHLVPELVPDRTRRPQAHIPSRLVQAGLHTPGAGMRTHLCLERIGEGGRLIVSMYLRAILQPPSLTWEVAAYAIPPLDGRFYRVDRLPVAPLERWWSLVRYATRRTGPELRGALGRILRRRRWAHDHERTLVRTRRAITKQHVLHDYGATGSLREDLGAWDEAGYTDRTDAQDFLFRLQQGVLTATERFLRDHNIDTSSFDKAVQVINTQTYNIGNVSGPSNFGAHGTILLGGQQGPGPHGGPGAQGTPGPAGSGPPAPNP
ncbi:hypothetical protein [Streptomyces naphthomycinicus]|uniref:hypothetical protein n=1 Tax=Streptomyces naphthomycinicus TaxID=2872625 RepID=UPI001CEC2280|nr:hypothetical protein [Streptomyces sp. TML10]